MCSNKKAKQIYKSITPPCTRLKRGEDIQSSYNTGFPIENVHMHADFHKSMV